MYEYLNFADYAISQGAMDRAEQYRQIANDRMPEENIIDVAYYLAVNDEDYDKAKEYVLQLIECAESDDDFFDAYSYLADTEEIIGENPDLVRQYGEKALYYAMQRIENIKETSSEVLFDLWKDAGDSALLAEEYIDAASCFTKALEYLTDHERLDTILIVKTDLAKSFARTNLKSDAMELLA